MAASCDLHINSSGENVLTEDVWGGFLELKESTESALTRFASEKHTVQGIKEISRRHLSLKRCHAKVIRILTGQAINAIRSAGGYDELKYLVREITTLLIKTRNDRDSAVDMFLNNSTQHPMMNCMEELKEEVTPLPAQLSPSPVTAISIVEEDTAVLYATATLMPVLLDMNIVETATQQQLHQHTLDAAEEELLNYQKKMELRKLGKEAGTLEPHVRKLRTFQASIIKDPVDLEISGNRYNFAARFPYDRGKLHF